MNGKLATLLTAAMAGLLAAASAPALAQQAKEGWYLGGGYGQSKNKFNNDDFAPPAGSGITLETDKTDSAWKLFLGYQYSELWGIEFMYGNLGQARFSYTLPGFGSITNKYETYSYALAATGTVPFTDWMGLHVRIGASRNRTDTNGTINVPGFVVLPAGDTNVGFYGGLGLRFDLNKTFSVRVDYDNFGKFGNTNTTGRATIDMGSINLMARFY